MPQYWLLKTEPSTYSIADLEREGRTTWDGVKNPLALIHLRAMRPGDRVLIYHSGKERAVVGRARVDAPPRTEGKATVVDLRFEARLPAPVPLAEIKREPGLAGLPLIRNTRLSVMPVTADEWEAVSGLVRGPDGTYVRGCRPTRSRQNVERCADGLRCTGHPSQQPLSNSSEGEAQAGEGGLA